MWPLSTLTVCSSDNSCLMYCKCVKHNHLMYIRKSWLLVCLPFWKEIGEVDHPAVQQCTVQWRSSLWICHVVCRASPRPRWYYRNGDTSPGVGGNGNTTLTANKSHLLIKSKHLLTLNSRQSTNRATVHGLGNVYKKRQLSSYE